MDAVRVGGGWCGQYWITWTDRDIDAHTRAFQTPDFVVMGKEFEEVVVEEEELELYIQQRTLMISDGGLRVVLRHPDESEFVFAGCEWEDDKTLVLLDRPDGREVGRLCFVEPEASPAKDAGAEEAYPLVQALYRKGATGWTGCSLFGSLFHPNAFSPRNPEPTNDALDVLLRVSGFAVDGFAIVSEPNPGDVRLADYENPAGTPKHYLI